MTNVDKLRKEVDSIQTSLDRLKDNISVLSEEDKKNRANELKNRAETTKVKIQAEIAMLSLQFGEDKKRQKAEAEVLLNTVNEIINLQLSILTGNNSGTAGNEAGSGDKGKSKGDSDKSSFWDSGRGNALKRTGIIGGIGAGISWIGSKLKGNDDDEEEDDEDESTEEKESGDKTKKKKKKKKKDKEGGSRFSNFLLKAGIATGTVVGGVELFKNWNRISSRVKEKMGLALSFNEAMYVVETEVRNGINDDDNFGNPAAHFEGLSYNEDTQEISSYGEKTKINKNKKEIDGMDGVQFASWEELIHAVNIVNFAKRELKGKGANETPFVVNSRTGDIDFNLSESGKTQFVGANGSNFGRWFYDFDELELDDCYDDIFAD